MIADFQDVLRGYVTMKLAQVANAHSAHTPWRNYHRCIGTHYEEDTDRQLLHDIGKNVKFKLTKHFSLVKLDFGQERNKLNLI